MIGIGIGVWFVAAFAIGATGLLVRSPVPPPAIALLLSAAVVVLIWFVKPLRNRVRKLGFGPLIDFHLTRLVAGIYFLILLKRGTLPAAFAIPAGWGDMVVGAAVFPILMFCLPMRTRTHRTTVLVWNVVGLVDILGVLVNAMRLFIGDPHFAAPFLWMPLALLPLFIVPIVIATHLWIFLWFRDERVNR